MTLEPENQPEAHPGIPGGMPPASTEFGQEANIMKRILMLAALCLLCLASAALAGQTTILVAFGTSQPGAEASLKAVEAAYARAGDTIIWAYTSDKIRAKLHAQGRRILSVDEAMNRAAELGVRHLRIQSLHIAPAEEFNQLQRMIVRNLYRHPGRFSSVMLGHPLLESAQDMRETVAAVLASLPRERTARDAVLLMGHGNDRGPGDLVLQAAATAFQQADPLIWLATVEGAGSIDHVLPRLREAGVRRVWLMPFMMVAGDHARNDLAGPEEDSWASRLRAAGMTPMPHLRGLGENPAIQRIFLRHTQAATDNVMQEKQ